MEGAKGTDEGTAKCNPASAPGSCVFVKTSSRSAKDSGILESRCEALFRQYLDASPEKDENARILAVLRAGTDMLRVHSADEALAMLLQSERIYQVRHVLLPPNLPVGPIRLPLPLRLILEVIFVHCHYQCMMHVNSCQHLSLFSQSTYLVVGRIM